MLGACRSIDTFEKLNPIGEGTYGTVFRARDARTDEIVALKKIYLHDSLGFPATALREIGLLLSIDHPNIVKLKEIVLEQCSPPRYSQKHSEDYKAQNCSNKAGRANSVSDVLIKQDAIKQDATKQGGAAAAPASSSVTTYLSFEYCDHDLASLVDHSTLAFSRAEVKCILQYLLRGVEALHLHHIVHRDIKLPNIFLTNKGEVKLGDFGLARLFSNPPEPLTADVVSLWYRPPELLFGLANYTEAIDLWSVGCVFAELLLNKPLFPGKNEEDQVNLICNLVGTPSSSIWPDVESLPKFKYFVFPHNPYNNIPLRFPNETPNCLDLLSRLLICDPNKRLTARAALRHPYFTENPLPKSPSTMPTFKEHRNETIMSDIINSPEIKKVRQEQQPKPQQLTEHQIARSDFQQHVSGDAAAAKEWIKAARAKRKGGLFSRW